MRSIMVWLLMFLSTSPAIASPDSLRHDSIRVEIAPIAESFSDYDEPGFFITVYNSLDTDILVGCDYANVKLHYVSDENGSHYESWDPSIKWDVPYGATLVKKRSTLVLSYLDLQSGERARSRWGLFINHGNYTVTMALLINVNGDLQEYEATCEIYFREHTEDEYQLLHELTECRNLYKCDSFVDDVEKIVGDRKIIPGRIVQMIVSCEAGVDKSSIRKRYYKKALALMRKLDFNPGYEHFLGTVDSMKKSFGRYDINEE